jgi:hypothetical protein
MKLFRSLSSALIVLSAIAFNPLVFAMNLDSSKQSRHPSRDQPSTSSSPSRPDSCQFIPKTGATIDDRSCSITHSNNRDLITVQWSDGVVTQFEILTRVTPGHQGDALVDGAAAQYETTMGGRMFFTITENQNKIALTFRN